MDQIFLTGIKGFAFHGVYPEERREGQNFSVDIIANVDLYPAGTSDDLNDAVDYSLVARAAHEELIGEPLNLIESVAERIAKRVLADFESIISVKVKVHKPDAPVGLEIADIAVEIERKR